MSRVRRPRSDTKLRRPLAKLRRRHRRYGGKLMRGQLVDVDERIGLLRRNSSAQ
ncbi:hypothetical protein [Mycobacterium simiae]|uniref:hypothetical protein n=1 Tax=Mycobacterium simiae TaxID=1784 RepID=UPI00165EFF88|nr:hypothetical protein [Mycobacterium simiae]